MKQEYGSEAPFATLLDTMPSICRMADRDGSQDMTLNECSE